MNTSAIPRSVRFLSMLADHAAMLTIAMICCMPWAVRLFTQATGAGMMTSPEVYLGLMGFSLYFCKDCIGGRSIGKRLLHLQVVTYPDGQIAGPMRCLIRNIWIILWPVELVATLINPGRRIGDRVAGTQVVAFEPQLPQSRLPIGETLLALLLAFGFMYMISLAPIQMLAAGLSQDTKYIEASRNEPLARQIEQQYQDSLGTYLRANVQVYDHIETDTALRYVSVRLELRQNYLEDDADFEDLRAKTVSLLLHILPERTFVAKLNYTYQQGGSFQSRIIALDWRE